MKTLFAIIALIVIAAGFPEPTKAFLEGGALVWYIAWVVHTVRENQRMPR